MSKLLIPLASLALGATGAWSVNYVTLQAATPGTPDNGNLNINGTIIGGKVMAGINSSVSMITGYAPNSTATGVQGLGKYYGMRGQSTTTAGASYGGYFDCNSPDGYGAWIRNKATSGLAVGLRLESDSQTGIGLDVSMPGAFGTNTGIRSILTTSSTSAKALSADGNSGYGLSVQAVGAQGYAIDATADQVGANLTSHKAQGIYSSSLNKDSYGIEGICASGGTGAAIYADGVLAASGTKTMRIDDPADPTGHYLIQYCTESDKPKLTYEGVATLDSSGSAWVGLPDYFDSINRDPTYQLTAIGAAMPNLHVATEEKNNRFQIGGGKPGAKVSWIVSGIRNDRFVKKYGAPDRVEKPNQLQGTYLRPELYDQPIQKHQDYDPKNESFKTRQANQAPPANKR